VHFYDIITAENVGAGIPLTSYELVDFEYDKTFLKSIVSDFFHFVLSVFIVGENQFWEEKISLKVHHKVAGGFESSKNRKIVLYKKISALL